MIKNGMSQCKYNYDRRRVVLLFTQARLLWIRSRQKLPLLVVLVLSSVLSSLSSFG